MRSVDIAAITAAPDMSVFIVSMPPAVLSDNPPESTPRPCHERQGRARTLQLVRRRTKRGSRSSPCPRPAHHPAARSSCSPQHLDAPTIRPGEVRASCDRRGRRPPRARSRGRAPRRRLERSAALDSARTLALTARASARASFDGCRGLVCEGTVARRGPSTNACAASPHRSGRKRRRHGGRHLRPSTRPRPQPRPSHCVDVERVPLAHSDSTAALAPRSARSWAPRSVSPRFASKPASVMNAAACRRAP
jgi:hypothetical protein